MGRDSSKDSSKEKDLQKLIDNWLEWDKNSDTRNRVAKLLDGGDTEALKALMIGELAFGIGFLYIILDGTLIVPFFFFPVFHVLPYFFRGRRVTQFLNQISDFFHLFKNNTKLNT
ncbi:unnamed protein product [Meloidogyne enterolobii]|uniref:Uncharacterized protein n=1 Tax=Meloidogyne enterolobii TaxID=390850 RepID=A0ACB1AJU3_MELEN